MDKGKYAGESLKGAAEARSSVNPNGGAAPKGGAPVTGLQASGRSNMKGGAGSGVGRLNKIGK